eukprot:2622590-Pyramimonas_sp.AAC.1
MERAAVAACAFRLARGRQHRFGHSIRSPIVFGPPPCAKAGARADRRARHRVDEPISMSRAGWSFGGLWPRCYWRGLLTTPWHDALGGVTLSEIRTHGGGDHLADCEQGGCRRTGAPAVARGRGEKAGRTRCCKEGGMLAMMAAEPNK